MRSACDELALDIMVSAQPVHMTHQLSVLSPLTRLQRLLSFFRLGPYSALIRGRISVGSQMQGSSEAGTVLPWTSCRFAPDSVRFVSSGHNKQSSSLLYDGPVALQTR